MLPVLHDDRRALGGGFITCDHTAHHHAYLRTSLQVCATDRRGSLEPRMLIPLPEFEQNPKPPLCQLPRKGVLAE